MAKIYYNLIKAGKKTIDDVPLRWRDEVQKLLDEEKGEGSNENSADVFDAEQVQPPADATKKGHKNCGALCGKSKHHGEK